MPLPKLAFTDRIAPHRKGHYVRCKRRGHKKLVKFIPGFKGDAWAYLNAHDAAYHNPFVDIPGVAVSIEIEWLCGAWMIHAERLEVEKALHPDTVRHYKLMCDHLRVGLRAIGVRFVREIEPSRLSEFVHWMRRQKHGEGATTVKALSHLKTMIRWKGLAAEWKIPHREIQAKKRVKRDLDASMIARLVAEMPIGSMEEAMIYLKARTGVRDVEIFEARKEEFDLDQALFEPILRSKRKQKRHVYALTRDVVAKIRPFVERAAASAYIFAPMVARNRMREFVRYRIRAAAKRAGFISKKKNLRTNRDGEKRYEHAIGAIQSLAPIRAEVATIVFDERSREEAADQLGHESADTTERWYYKDRLTKEKLEQKRARAEAVAKAIPLRPKVGPKYVPSVQHSSRSPHALADSPIKQRSRARSRS